MRHFLPSSAFAIPTLPRRMAASPFFAPLVLPTRHTLPRAPTFTYALRPAVPRLRQQLAHLAQRDRSIAPGALAFDEPQRDHGPGRRVLDFRPDPCDPS